MKQITDSLLLVTAEIAATLIGLLLVAVFFYLETGVPPTDGRWGRGSTFPEGDSEAPRVQVLDGGRFVSGARSAASVVGERGLHPLSIAIVAGVVEVVPPRPQPYRRRSTRRSHPAVAAVGPWRAGNRAGRFSRSLEGVVAFMNTASLLLLAFNLAAIEGATDPNR